VSNSDAGVKLRATVVNVLTGNVLQGVVSCAT
jgi:hypothetical protein